MTANDGGTMLTTKQTEEIQAVLKAGEDLIEALLEPGMEDIATAEERLNISKFIRSIRKVLREHGTFVCSP